MTTPLFTQCPEKRGATFHAIFRQMWSTNDSLQQQLAMAKSYISQLTTRVQGLEGGLLHTGQGLASGQGMAPGQGLGPAPAPMASLAAGTSGALVNVMSNGYLNGDQTTLYWDKHKTEVAVSERDIEIEKLSMELLSSRGEIQRLQESIKEMELSMMVLLRQSDDQSRQSEDLAVTKATVEAVVGGLTEQCEKQDHQLSLLRSHLDEILIEKVECSEVLCVIG